MATRTGSGELGGSMPNPKRKQPQAGGAGAEPPAPLQQLQRPACSSPALGWTLRCEEHDSCDATSDSARDSKALRICAASAAEAAQGAALEAPAGCGASGMHAVCSVPLAMLHIYHAGCCSRLGSSSSLSELDAATAGSCGDLAVAAAADDCPDALPTAEADAGQAAEQQQQQQQQQQPATSYETEQLDSLFAAAAVCDPPAAAAAALIAGRAAGAATPWAEVPDDILRRVLDQLQPSTLRVLRLVCRGWEAAASRLLVHLRPEGIAGKQLGHRFPSLHSLDLSNCCMGVDFTTPRMLRLQSLLCNEHLGELAGLSRLEQLSLRGCSRLTGAGLAQLGCLRRSLTMLNLSNCTGLTDDCLAALAAALPQLATLNLQGCSGLGDEGISHLVNMPHLRHILLPGGVTDSSMCMLAEMPALERVALRGCRHVSTAGIYVLLQRPGLKRVVISKCPQISLESSGGHHLKVVTDRGGGAAAAAADAALVAAGAVAPLAGPAGMAGQDMQLLRAARHSPSFVQVADGAYRLTQHWYLLPGLTIPIPVSVGLFRGDRGWVVVDAGTKNNRRQSHATNLVKAVQAVIPAGERVAAIALTHDHHDHVGALVELMAAYPDAPVLLHSEEAPFLFEGKPYMVPGSLDARKYQWFDMDWPVRPKLAKERFHFVSGKTGSLDQFARGLSFHLAPGHTPGQVVYLHKSSGVLFGGDILTLIRPKLSWGEGAAAQQDNRVVAAVPGLLTVRSLPYHVLHAPVGDLQLSEKSACQLLSGLPFEKALLAHDFSTAKVWTAESAKAWAATAPECQQYRSA